MDFLIEFNKFKDFFEPQLKIFLNNRISISASINPTGKILLQEVQKASLGGGKRLRPILAYHSFGLINDTQKNLQDISYLGISLELFHTFCLVHDDFIDKSSLRRGQKTIHEVYKDNFKTFLNEQQSAHLGSSAAVLGGDLAFVLAEMAFGSIKNPNKEFVNIYQQMQLEVCLGQSDDTFGTGITDLDKLTEAQVLNMLDYKSGRYSIEKPLLLGATLAGISEDKKLVLSEFGIRLGIVFQLVDDILGLFGDDLITGKSTISDLAEGKRTLILLRTYNLANQSEKIKIKNLLGNENLTLSDLEWFKDLAKSTGVLQSIQEFCSQEVKIIQTLLINGFDNSLSRDFLILLSSYILNRKS